MDVDQPERLPTVTLTLSIEDAINEGYTPDEVSLVYWWECKDRIYELYDEVQAELLDRWENSHGCNSRTSASAKRVDADGNSTSNVDRQRSGLTVPELAERLQIELATFRALLEHHLILELVPVGGQQRRRLLSDEAEREGLGHNVFPTTRIGHLEGHEKSAPFPVLYEDRLDDLTRMIDWQNIQAEVAAKSSKRSKLTWLLEHHPYLPDAELARLSGYSVRSVERGRALHVNDNQPNEAAVAA